MSTENQEIEFINPADFTDAITKEIDQYFEDEGYNEMWLSKETGKRDPEEVKTSILNRLFVGYYNEIYIRDTALALVSCAPDLKTNQALLKQGEDEHKHAMWIVDLLGKRGYDPRVLGRTPSRAYAMFWDYVFGRIHNVAHENDPLKFLSVVATTQLVNERLFGLRATAAFAENIVDYDAEVAELYGGKIRRDEILHVIQLPEMILERHATTPEAQQVVREGVERCKFFLRLTADEMRDLQKKRPVA